MATPVSREQIENTLKAFASGNLRDNARRLFNVLGYRSERRQDLSPNTADGFTATFDSQKKLNAERALRNQWRSVDLLFQLASEDINVAASERLPLSGGRVDNTIIESYLFFAIELVGSHYTRTQLSRSAKELRPS
jgi:adenine-specific DNA-methyltransferase